LFGPRIDQYEFSSAARVKQVLVTGGTGYIGSHTVVALTAVGCGESVTTVVRGRG
jgi:nucleoside-diphosphate-sugar epimerase